MGLEPTRLYRHKILSLARLPIPTPPQRKVIYHLSRNKASINYLQYIVMISYKGKNKKALFKSLFDAEKGT